MAQFSSLEQMTNMSKQFGRMQNMIASNHAVSLIGKSVNIVDGGEMVIGVVEEVSGNEYPQLLVNGKYYGLDKIEKIR
jgi:flagellar basal-body rod modification protein FlgD